MCPADAEIDDTNMRETSRSWPFLLLINADLRLIRPDLKTNAVNFRTINMDSQFFGDASPKRK